jgi:hypothetical protein
MVVTPPAQGEDVRILHRKVAELCDIVTALCNMTAIVEGRQRMIGRLAISGGHSVLTINNMKTVGDDLLN